MLTSDTLINGGLNSKLSMTCKSSITTSSSVAGFGPLVVEYSGPVYGELKGGTLSLEKSGWSQSNGVFIRNTDDKVTTGILVRGGFFASDQFGGCDLTILRAPGGALMGAHVYSSDACRKAVQAVPNGWRVVGTWKSAGYLQKWPGISALFAFGFVEGTKIKVVAMGLKGYPPWVSNLELGATFDV